jgi:hypothetical protein
VFFCALCLDWINIQTISTFCQLSDQIVNKLYFMMSLRHHLSHHTIIYKAPIKYLNINLPIKSTGTCFIQKIYAPSSSLLQGKYLPFPTSAQYFSLICDPFADPIISLHSRNISLFDCHI